MMMMMIIIIAIVIMMRGGEEEDDDWKESYTAKQIWYVVDLKLTKCFIYSKIIRLHLITLISILLTYIYK